jgi:hypothetical protein
LVYLSEVVAQPQRLENKKGLRLGMADGCHEKMDLTFGKWTWDFPKRSRPKVEAMLEKYGSGKTAIRLRSTAEIEEYLDRLRVNERMAPGKIAARI